MLLSEIVREENWLRGGKCVTVAAAVTGAYTKKAFFSHKSNENKLLQK